MSWVVLFIHSVIFLEIDSRDSLSRPRELYLNFFSCNFFLINTNRLKFCGNICRLLLYLSFLHLTNFTHQQLPPSMGKFE